MRFVVLALSLLLVLVACTGADPTSTPVPTSTPTPAPTATPSPKPLALQWAGDNAEVIADLVVEAIMAAPEVEERVPALVRLGAPTLLSGIIEDDLGNALTVAFVEAAYEGESRFSATLQVSGSVAIDLGPFESVDVGVPVVILLDTDSEQALEWMAILPESSIELR